MKKDILSDHNKFADDLQNEIYRKMSGEDKLELTCSLYWSARALKVAALRERYPDWSEERILKEVRKIFLYA
jgi:hypothetical protein